MGALANRLGGDAEQTGEVRVRAILLEDQLYDSALIRCEGVEAHGAGSVAERIASKPRMSDVPVDQQGLNGVLGFEFQQADGEGARGSFMVDERHLQPYGIVHGGCYAALAEAMASMGTYVGNGGDKFVAGLSNHTSFLRPVTAGDTVTAVGTPKHRGRTTWVWEVEMTNGAGKPCALVRVTVAVRDRASR